MYLKVLGSGEYSRAQAIVDAERKKIKKEEEEKNVFRKYFLCAALDKEPCLPTENIVSARLVT